jgi:hypothetical protein
VPSASAAGLWALGFKELASPRSRLLVYPPIFFLALE